MVLRARTQGEGDRPILGLDAKNFGVLVDGQPVGLADWKSPQEATPPPAWVVVLLDFSGSMRQLDSTGQTKLQGAVEAIRKFKDTLGDRAGNTQVSIVPFGVTGAGCPPGSKDVTPSVNSQTLDRFNSAADAELDVFLDNLLAKEKRLCASTDLYSPVIEATEFLTNPADPRFNVPSDSGEPEPRLAVILVSDGFHYNSSSITESDGMERLRQITASNPDLTIHTLGYGLTPEELQQNPKYELKGPATVADVNSGKVPPDEFVDQESLEEIASLTGGMNEFSGDAAKISQDLQLFLDALLGEYELDYIEPNPERASKHRVQVILDESVGGVVSEPKKYRIEVFGRSLPLPTRLTMLAIVMLSMGILGIIPFWFWANGLKKELE